MKAEYLILSLLLNLSGGAFLPAQKQVFKAGASVSNITPSLGAAIVGNTDMPPATYIHDQLHARSLVLDDGTTKLAFVLVDNVSIDREVFDAAKKQIYDETGIPAGNVLMAATHTHSGTSARGTGNRLRGWHLDEPLDEYQTFLARRIADGVRVAIANLEPAKIAWGAFDAPEHVFVRRWVMKDSVTSPLGHKEIVRMNPGFLNPGMLRPSGPVDPEFSFLAIKSRAGRPIAILGNYSLHYIGGVPKGHISADYFAVFGNRLEELLEARYQSPSFVGILSNGTSANVNNRDLTRSDEKRAPYEKMRIVGNDLAERVYRQYNELKFRDWVPLGSRQTELKLAVRRADPELLSKISRAASPSGKKPAVSAVYIPRILQLEYEWPDSIDISLQVVRVGDLVIPGIPFEVFTQTGLDIKSRSPFKDTFTISLANGAYGYLPTPEEHKLGGYETWLSVNKVEKEASTKISERILEMMRQLK